MKNKIIITLFISFLILPMTCLAEPPLKPGNNNTSVSHKGATTISSNKVFESKSFTSSTAGENAILVTSGDSTINNCTITKTGSGENESSDFYGTNAGLLAKSGTLNIKNSTIITTGSYANGVFSYDKGIINISDSGIETNLNNSGGVMVSGGGTLIANNLTVKTTGDSSAAIRSDRGGGELTVKKGEYSTSGKGSPVIYSTANVSVEGATLTSTSAEGAVVEGANSITLKNTKLEDTNESLNGNSETYKNIFLYQSMSGDADEGNSTFTAESSNIITHKGDTIFVTNTKATINLTNNKITNEDGDFLRIQKGKWGNEGSNGGNVTLNTSNQKIEGNIIVDKISSLEMNIKNKSVIKSAINKDNIASKLEINLSKDSVIVLSDDAYLTKLTNENNNNQNIYLNGHTLYVNGKKVKANTGTYKETKEVIKKKEKKKESSKSLIAFLGIIALVIVIVSVIVTIIKRNKSNI